MSTTCGTAKNRAGNDKSIRMPLARGEAVARAGCWAHTRRNFEARLESDPAAAKALELIWELYKTERRIAEQGLEGAEKLAARRGMSVPAMAAFWEWHAAETAVERLPKDPFLKALNYAGSRRAELEIFLSDPDVPIDTNHLERGVRPIACGRKNRLFRLDRGRRRADRVNPEPAVHLRPARRRPVCVARRCPAARGRPSHEPGPRADAARVEDALRRQPDAVARRFSAS